MRFGETHYNMSRMMRPHTPRKRLRMIHHDIDNPTPEYKMFKKMMRTFIPQKSIINPLLSFTGGHRQDGHDLIDMVILSQKYGPEGVQAWIEHQGQDIFSDFIVTRHGVFARNLFEDGINHLARTVNRNKRVQNRYVRSRNRQFW